jgi:hypothetical protein
MAKLVLDFHDIFNCGTQIEADNNAVVIRKDKDLGSMPTDALVE